MNHASRILAVLYVAAIPVLLVSASVTYAFNELRLYEYGFDHYNVSRVTGIPDADLKGAARQIRSYFNSRQEPLVVTARVNGRERSIFTPQEATHMKDVKHLVWGVYGVGAAAALFLAGTMALGFVRRHQGFGLQLTRSVMWGSVATVALVLGVGLFSLVGFDSLFLWFHEVSFGNDFWRLDPNRHYLVMMFPQGFWQDATLFVGFLALGQSVLLGGVSTWWVLRSQRASPHSTEVSSVPHHAPDS